MMPGLQTGKTLAGAGGEQFYLPVRGLDALFQRRQRRYGLTGYRGGAAAENPRISESAPGGHGKIAAGVAQNMGGVLGFKYVSVGDGRNIHGAPDVPYNIPVGPPSVHLHTGSAVDGDGGRAGALAHFCKFHGVNAAAVEALAELDGNRHVHRLRHAGDYSGGQRGIPHQSGAVAGFDDLSDWAAHIDVQNISAGDVQCQPGGLGHDLGFVAEDLHGGRMLAGG